MKTNTKILCWVTVFDQEKQIRDLLQKIKSFKPKIKIDFLIINNGSKDRSKYIISSSKFKTINFSRNRGIGYSLIASIKYALKMNYDVLIQMAGNNKMLPMDIPSMIDPILKKNYHYVAGSRFCNKNNYITTPFFRKILIKILSFFITIFYKKKITDATCGFRAFKVGIFKNKISSFDKKKFYTYGFEYYSYGKILLSKKIKSCERGVLMNYPETGKYSHIRPFIDWLPIIFGYLEAKLDKKKIF